MVISFGGLASGLDTNGIIDQLVALQRQPIYRLDQRATEQQVKINAWGKISTQVSNLRTAVDELTSTGSFDSFVSATSSHEDVVAVAVTGKPGSSATTFTVDQLATRHQLMSDDATPFSSADALVGAGTFTVTVDGTAHDFVTTGGTTLQDLADIVNNAGIGVSASALKITDGDYRLSMTSDDTGSGSAFTASGDQPNLGVFDTVQTAQDAQITVGSGASAVTISRESNTVTDLIDGVSLTLKQVSAAPVTVSTDRDIDAAAEKIQGFVDAANNVLSMIDTFTDYDADTEKASALMGDTTARDLSSRLVQSILDEVSEITGDLDYAGGVGLSIDRYGTLTLNETELKDALASDFDGVAGLFTRSFSSPRSDVALTYASDDTVAGTYNVNITQAAERASNTGAVYSPPGADVAFSITDHTGAVANVTVTGGSSLDDAISQINTQLQAAGVATVTAEKNAAGDSITLTETRHGSKYDYTVSGSAGLGLDGTFAGQDVAGTIDGVAATGSGQNLASESANTGKLTLKIKSTAADITAAGGSIATTATFSHGLAGRTSVLLDEAEGVDGIIAMAEDRYESQIDIIDDQIERYEERVEAYEDRLRRQFAAMENMLSNLQSQASFMSMIPPPAAAQPRSSSQS